MDVNTVTYLGPLRKLKGTTLTVTLSLFLSTQKGETSKLRNPLNYINIADYRYHYCF